MKEEVKNIEAKINHLKLTKGTLNLQRYDGQFYSLESRSISRAKLKPLNLPFKVK